VSEDIPLYDVAVIGGGPAGTTAAMDLARRGRRVALIDRGGRIKPCGGALPPAAMRQFDIPESQLVARIAAAEVVAPSRARVRMEIGDGYVGMVDRGPFDEWLRERAAAAGASRVTGTAHAMERDADGRPLVLYRDADKVERRLAARQVIAADGAVSPIGRQAVPEASRTPYVTAYHEIVRSPKGASAGYMADRCDVYYDKDISPDFYGWVFPHGDTASVGVGSGRKGFGLKAATAELRARAGLAEAETLRCEGAPLPLHPHARWDNGRDVVLAGDSAGVVAPASGEGIFYALLGGRLAADAVEEALSTGDGRALAQARARFMKAHGKVFWMLGQMQRFWYSSDARRESFVRICRDRDVQHLTWDAYINKAMTAGRPSVHARILVKNVLHLAGLAA
jgi:geranylgeranyl reductase